MILKSLSYFQTLLSFFEAFLCSQSLTWFLPSRMNSPFSLSHHHKPSRQIFGQLSSTSIFFDSADIEPE